jgi:lipopolysaccharide/colanic/teichoic acid biosynthesis glycosyltransferase
MPVIAVRQTPLFGWGRIVKRLFDLGMGSIFLLIAIPFMILIAIAIKLSDPKGPVFMRGKAQNRLTRFDQVFKVYKFRTHYAKFDGKSDEEVFEMVGKPELIKEYRANGDQLDNDFRVTPVGRFLRATSLDELPQFINVVKGDISLVGPRALVPQELAQYAKKHTILSVKSGLTGLAVVSGRRDIPYEERRKLDVYYVQNWSFWLDITILLKTVRIVLERTGAK